MFTSLVLNPFPPHTTHSCSELSLLLLDIQLTLFFSDLEVTTQTDANVVLCLPKYWAVERLLLHLACFEFLVLLFQSLLNSKCGDCYCWDKHKGICITELAVSTPKEILYNFLISKGIALISFWWCFPADILELAQKQFIPSWNGSCPVILLDLYMLGFNYRTRLRGWIERKAKNTHWPWCQISLTPSTETRRSAFLL